MRLSSNSRLYFFFATTNELKRVKSFTKNLKVFLSLKIKKFLDQLTNSSVKIIKNTIRSTNCYFSMKKILSWR